MNPSRASQSAIVVGGGVIGLFTAWRLLDAGFAVTVLERDRFGMAGALAASWAGGGILSPLPPWQAPPAVWDMASASIAEYPEIAAMLADETGIDPEWTESGMWVLDVADPDAAIGWGSEHSLAVNFDRSLRHDEPRAAAYLPWVAQVRTPRLLKALAIYLRDRGAVLVEGCEVTGFVPQGDAPAVCCRDRSSRAADVLVLCAGAWTRSLGEALDVALPIAPVRGQMLLLQGEPGQLTSIVLAGDRYLIPRRDGCILVGSTLEDVGFAGGITASARESLHASAAALLPATRDMPVLMQWSGLRPATGSGIPLVGRVAGLTRVFVNAGHHRNGITMAPASARQLLAAIKA